MAIDMRPDLMLGASPMQRCWPRRRSNVTSGVQRLVLIRGQAAATGPLRRGGDALPLGALRCGSSSKGLVAAEIFAELAAWCP
jgi:hypothetical protein